MLGGIWHQPFIQHAPQFIAMFSHEPGQLLTGGVKQALSFLFEFHHQDGVICVERLLRSPEHIQLGAFDVELHKIHSGQPHVGDVLIDAD